jgi:hypothetical protein
MPSTMFDLQEHPTSAYNDDLEGGEPTVSERLDSWLSLAALGLVWLSGAAALWW